MHVSTEYSTTVSTSNVSIPVHQGTLLNSRILTITDMHKVLHKKSPSTVTEWMDPNEEAHTNSPSSSTCKLYHSLECTSTLMISCLSVVHTTSNLDRSVCLHSLMGKNWGGRVQMKTLIVEDRPDYLKVLYVSAFFIDYWGTHFESFTFWYK